MGKKKHKEPYVKRDLYVYDTVWWVGFVDGYKTYHYSIPSVETLDEIFKKFPDAKDIRIFTKESVFPFIIH